MEQNDNSFTLDDIYFKDAFTKVDDKINADLNRITLNCLVSKNNKFRLDSEGNLFVKSITVEESIGDDINYNEILNLVYPVGSVYLSLSNVNPGTLFGGTWEQISQGRTLVGVDGNDTDFNESSKTGGEKSHVLTIEEMPKHDHYPLNSRGYCVSVDGYNANAIAFGNTINSMSAKTSFAGESQPHNNLQPYFTCYIWKRIA